MTNNKTQYCGYVAFVGRPNVGKSTLLNRLMGEKVSITASTPQTTRHQIMGVQTKENRQTIYVDTPGLHDKTPTALNKQMNKAAWSVFNDVDVLVFVVDRTQWSEQETAIVARLQHDEFTTPVLVAINKVDHLNDKSQLLPVLEQLSGKLDAKGYFPLSAKTGDGVPALEHAMQSLLPQGPHLFGASDKTNRQLSFLLAELIREKCIRFLGDELPHVTGVEIERIEKKSHCTDIHACIWVERDSQKKIIIGKDGQTLKRIATLARHDCEKCLHHKVMLRLWVKVKPGWRDDTRFLKGAGFMDDG